MTNQTNDWTDGKHALIEQMNHALTGWTNASPRPHELIDQLLEILPYVQISNHAEYQEYQAWWDQLTAACNPARPPAL